VYGQFSKCGAKRKLPFSFFGHSRPQKFGRERQHSWAISWREIFLVKRGAEKSATLAGHISTCQAQEMQSSSEPSAISRQENRFIIPALKFCLEET
jgi:hypothetical protein